MRWLALLLLLLVAPAHAALDPREMLPDPAQEARARAIGKELRCLVCQNQSIDDSNAELARDLRVLVRERIAAGDSDTAVRQFVVARYGEYVLLTPPFNARTALLWVTPFAVVLVALAGAALWLRRRRVAPPAPLSDAERQRVRRLLEDDA
jgi:cytochrome c-type biogenesis protein CcmH